MLRRTATQNVPTTQSAGPGPIVDTVFGPVEGIYLESDGAQAFYGVPFAAPPVGDLRWKDPQDPVPWGPDIWLATENPPGCPQICEGVNPPIDCPAKVYPHNQSPSFNAYESRSF